MKNSKTKNLAVSCLVLSTCLTSSLYADWTDKISILGYGNVNIQSETSGASGVAHDYNTFSNEDFDLVVNFQPNRKFRAVIDLGFEEGVITEDGKGSLNLEYSFFEYTHMDSLKFRFGKQFSAFGIYNEFRGAKVSYLTTDRPGVTNNITKTAGGPEFFPQAATGVSVLGDLDVLDGLNYHLMVSNGTNIGEGEDNNQFSSDNDYNKAVTGRTILSLTDSWDLGVSAHYEKYKIFGDEGDPSTGNRKLFSYGAQLTGDILEDLSLEAELMAGSFQDTDILGTTGDKVNRLAYTAMLAYNFGSIELLEDLTVYTRYGFADADTDNKVASTFKGKVKETSAGLNYEFYAEGTSRVVFKLEYRYVDADEDTQYALAAGDIDKSLYFSDVTAQIAASF